MSSSINAAADTTTPTNIEIQIAKDPARAFLLEGDIGPLIALIQESVDRQLRESNWWALEDWYETTFRQLFYQIIWHYYCDPNGTGYNNADGYRVTVIQEQVVDKKSKKRADIILTLVDQAAGDGDGDGDGGGRVVAASTVELKLVNFRNLSYNYYRKVAKMSFMHAPRGSRRSTAYNKTSWKNKAAWFAAVDDIFAYAEANAEKFGGSIGDVLEHIFVPDPGIFSKGSSIKSVIIDPAVEKVRKIYAPCSDSLFNPRQATTFHAVVCWTLGRVMHYTIAHEGEIEADELVRNFADKLSLKEADE
jgi:hypothetical protein